MSKVKNLMGETFGKLSVLSYAGSIGGRAAWSCQCECGNTCIVKGKYLLNGDTRSCGCLVKEAVSRIGKRNVKTNRYEMDGDIIKVYFSNSDSFFICDRQDEDFVLIGTWFLNNTGYARTKLSSDKSILFHNLIVPNSSDAFCDHINGDRLDNRRENLRVVSREQNSMNKGVYSNNTSGHKGVSFNTGTKKWQAYICKDGINKYLGGFDNIEDAIKTRDCAELEMFGEYRRMGL